MSRTVKIGKVVPVKGVDYYTASEKAELESEIEDYVINSSTSAFNQNATQKTNEFNTNATNKTTAFNNNASSKTGDFDTNASNKTTTFNNNASSKTGDFNTNATNKTNAFNSNATDKTTAYDNNHTDKLGAYNSNDTAKTTAYNDNATAKTTAFNDNYEDKIDLFDEHSEELQAELDRYKTLENALPHVNGEGECITLNDTANSPLSMELEPTELSQVTTTGKNLWGGFTFSKSNNGINFTYNKDGSITASGTATDTALSMFSGDASSYYKTLSAGTYTISGGVNAEQRIQVYDSAGTELANAGSTNPSFTLTETKQIWIRARISSGEVVNTTYKVQLENGSTATSYEPYTNGASPNPDYPQTIHTISGDNTVKVENKNLLPLKAKDLTLNTYIGNDGSEQTSTSGNYYGSFTYIDFKYSERTITLSNGLEMAFYDKDKTFIRYVGRTESRTFTAPSNSKYIRIDCYKDNINEMQIELGSTATTYVPHQEKIAELNLPVENLFDKDNANVLNAYLNSSNKVQLSDDERMIYISCKPNTTYTITKDIATPQNKNRYRVGTTATTPENGVSLLNKVYYDMGNTVTTITITTPSDAAYLCVYLWSTDNTSSLEDMLNSIQIEYGTKANNYTPYGTTPIEYCKIGDYKDEIKKSTGKNLYEGISFTRNNNGIDYTYNSDGSINANGTSTGNALSMVTSEATPYLITLSAGIYTISGGKANINIQIMDANGINLAETTSSSFYKNFTLDSETQVYVRLLMTSGKSANNEKIYPMLNKGQTALPYEPYGKIWYLQKKIGKVVLNGSENGWSIANSGTANWYYFLYNAKIKTALMQNNQYSSHYLNREVFNSNTTQGFMILNSGNMLRIRYGSQDTLDNFKNWLSTHNTIVYYVLATPTYTLLNDTLQSQLETIYNKLLGYQEQTNISQENNDLAFNIKAKAVYDLNKLVERVTTLENE